MGPSRRLGRVALVAGVVLGAWSIVGRAAAAEPQITLVWSAPPSCPDRSAVLAQIERMVGVPPKAPVSANVTIDERDDGFDVTLELHGGAEGRRALHAATCAAAARGAALLVALAIDPSADPTAPAEPAPRPPPPPPPPAPAPPPPAPRAPAPSPTPGPEVRAYVGASVTRAIAPGVATALVLGARVSWRGLRLDVEGELAPALGATSPTLPGVGADLRAYALAARTCILHTFGSIEGAGCVALRGTRLEGEATGVTEPTPGGVTVLALEPGLSVRVPARARLGLSVDGAAVLPLTRPELVVTRGAEAEPIGKVAPIGVRIGAAVSFRF